MKPRHLAGPNALLMLVVALAGCAPRSVPASFPASSAASPQAAEAPSPRIGVALAEDPPLPGEPTAGWVGLEPASAPGADPHQHHHHHHHGAAPAPTAPSGHQHHDPGAAPAPAPPAGQAPPRPKEPAHAH
ncbi:MULTISPECIES: hypothetical protein [Sorangium]|uniref:Secreted protein n=1 Tax=Sorangium cellulosum TaxID=56 RepID=A0A4P2QFP4_SORCE|nr:MULTISPECIES: hypothetical protein [Sorangium]AUX28690.1 uncharacterized protein SOCE836_007710 [Sorangium cellulosum]WCQ88087.1 hypothetical protein NQZ70_00759 [Sorangium sp. Soce836]